MNVAFISTRLAGVDWVSLETAKLVDVFKEKGHNCYYIAGELGDEDGPAGREVPAMHFTHPEARQIHDDAFLTTTPPPDLYQRIYASADAMRGELEAFVEEYAIDLIVPQNASTIPMNISLGVAIADLIKRTSVKALCHHHDFYWERDRFINNHIQDVLDEAFPPRHSNIRHMVINTVMQQRLKAWRGIDASYLPNVFDFENPPLPPDEYAMSFRPEFGLSEHDLIVLQPTRIIRRKAIEKAIELVRKLDDNRLVFLVTGYEGDEATEYGAWLREEAERAGIRYQFMGERVKEKRGMINGEKVFALWDIYPHAHFVTYPSVYEGFGNAFVEAMYFRKPIVVHTYPVYLSDIKASGVEAIEFFHDITSEVLTHTRRMIDSADVRQRMTAHNYEVGLQHFSYRNLKSVIEKILTTL